MAKIERILVGDFDSILSDIETEVLNGSFSASVEDSSDYVIGDTRCAVRVYERYSYSGGNRVSMSVVLIAVKTDVRLTIITSGGSQGVFFKINTWGEEAFLDTVLNAVNKYSC